MVTLTTHQRFDRLVCLSYQILDRAPHKSEEVFVQGTAHAVLWAATSVVDALFLKGGFSTDKFLLSLCSEQGSDVEKGISVLCRIRPLNSKELK